jgi:hypothetical protein
MAPRWKETKQDASEELSGGLVNFTTTREDQHYVGSAYTLASTRTKNPFLFFNAVRIGNWISLSIADWVYVSFNGQTNSDRAIKEMGSGVSAFLGRLKRDETIKHFDGVEVTQVDVSNYKISYRILHALPIKEVKLEPLIFVPDEKGALKLLA